MATLSELRQLRAKAWDEARNFLDTKSKDGILSAEDSAIYEKEYENKITELSKAIEREEKLEKMNNAFKAPTSSPILTNPGTSKQDNYKNEFIQALRIKNYNKIGTDTDGGYLVPDEFDRTLIQKLEEENVMRGLATIIRTNSGDHQIPVVESQGTAYLASEGAVYQESDPTFGQQVLGAYKIICRTVLSEELLNDSAFDLENFLADNFARRVGALEEQLFCTGTGTNQPTGVFITAEQATEVSSTSISFDDIMELFYSVKTPYRKKGTWLMNDTTVKALRKLKDSTGNYIWQPALSANVPDMILGRPYQTSAYAPTLEAGKTPIAFGDFSYYWIAERQTRTFKRLGELYAENGLVGFIGNERIDGKLILPEAVKKLTVAASSK